KSPGTAGVFFACASPACGRIAALAGWSQCTCKRVWLAKVACNTPLHAQAATSLADHLATSQYVLSAMQEPIAGYCNK
ncbi:hypothetical protein, partial [Xanthomonas phaseoli]|uniref:hypothetical protein n=1 Tax=Xanthomonas phaseoli TaxID=1985254 RepID=UPI0035F42C44